MPYDSKQEHWQVGDEKDWLYGTPWYKRLAKWIINLDMDAQEWADKLRREVEKEREANRK